MELVFDQNSTRIYFHPEHKVLHLKWHGPNCRDIYVEVLKALKQLTLDLEVEGWLFDLSGCHTIDTDVINGNVDDLANALTASKLKKFARVSSKDLNYEVSIRGKIDYLNEALKLKLNVGYFKAEPEALAWLFDASEGSLVDEE